MDIDKTSKNEPEIIDVNNIMNRLLNKVSIAVSEESSPQRKDLVEIRDLLVQLRDVDKTLSYNLLPETIRNIQKALNSVRVSNPERLKEAEAVGDALGPFDKLPPEEIPKTDQEAAEKFNQIVNTQLDATIKTVNEVILMTEAVEKTSLETPKGQDSVGKILNEVLIGLLGDRLKQVNDVFLPEDMSDKNTNEFEINPNRQLKQNNQAFTQLIQDEKQAPEVERPEAIEEKQARRIGEISVFGRKQSVNVGDAETSNEKQSVNVGDAETSNEKQSVNVGDAEIAAEKSDLDIAELENDGAQKNNLDIAELEEPAIPKEALEVGDAVGPTEKDVNPIGNAGTEGTKPSHPERWYERLFFQSPNAIGVNNFSAFGGTFDLGGGNFAAGVGGTLAFFAVNLADITRYVVKGIRTFNTSANALEITSSLLIIESQRDIAGGQLGAPKTVESEANADLSEDITVTAARRNLNDKDTARRLAENAGPQSPENIVEYLSTRLEELVASRFQPFIREADSPASGGVSGLTALDKGVFGSSNTIVEGYDQPGEDETYKNLFRDRTYQITGLPRSTGFMKIYLKRGPKFVNSQEDIVLIPFQFEPKISGDSKSADYQAISTLARSQAAQAYRRSQERNITLELRYLVTGQSMDENRPQIGGESRSKSALGMELWDEEYVYTYIIRNLRNLALPNISDPSYRLGPPIVQVWYGGITNLGASTGEGNSGTRDSENSLLNDVHPAFRTNWFSWSSSGYAQHSYRSLWVCKNVSFDYQGGVISRVTRNTVQVIAQVQLTEIAPSITDNEPLVWRRLTRG